MQKRDKLEISYQPSLKAFKLTAILLLISTALVLVLHFSLSVKIGFVFLAGILAVFTYRQYRLGAVAEIAYVDGLWYLRLRGRQQTRRRLAKLQAAERLSATAWMLVFSSPEKHFAMQRVYLAEDNLSQAQFRALNRILLNPLRVF